MGDGLNFLFENLTVSLESNQKKIMPTKLKIPRIGALILMMLLTCYLAALLTVGGYYLYEGGVNHLWANFGPMFGYGFGISLLYDCVGALVFAFIQEEL